MGGNRIIASPKIHVFLDVMLCRLVDFYGLEKNSAFIIIIIIIIIMCQAARECVFRTSVTTCQSTVCHIPEHRDHVLRNSACMRALDHVSFAHRRYIM